MDETNLSGDEPGLRPAAISESRERKLVFLFCLLAAVHVFIFCAAFPFFNNMDEIPQFDLVVKYAHGHLPRGLEPMGEASSLYTMTYNSPEFISLPKKFPGGHYPTPFWKQPGQSQKVLRDAAFQKADASWRVAKNLPFWTNYESSQQPLYYALAGLWWHAGQWLGLAGLPLVYWVRFLNIFFVAALTWTGYAAARLIFPDQLFLRLGVPAMLAFFPQQTFYSIQNDVLSPLCFGAAFIFLIKLLRAEIPPARLGIFTGVALAATFLAKISNAPMLFVAVIAIAFKMFQSAKAGKLRAAWPAFASLIFCAGAPIAGWLAWSKYAFGDWTGAAEKLRFITWTLKPVNEWWPHPIFTLQGFWTFLSGLLVTFWQGEFRWHAQPLDLPVVDAFYVVPTLCFLVLAIIGLAPRFAIATAPQRRALWLSLACVVAGVAFLAFLSIIYDFGICINPSRGHPFLTSGRLMLGTLIPFLLLYLYGINFLLRGEKNKWLRAITLAGIILFMLASEIITDGPVFFSQYNWYHL
ncbi:MAG TPA: DUF2142 domain-containing protein [Verrucomicrobiae bacterium]